MRRLAGLLLCAAACAACGHDTVPRSGDGGFDPAPARAALEAGNGDAALEAANDAIGRATPRADVHELASRVEELALAFYESGHATSAETLFVEALDLRERNPDADPEATASLLHDLSTVAFNRGDLAAAEDYERRSIGLRERIAEPEDPALACSRRDLGFVFLSQGRLAEAEPLLVASSRMLEADPQVDWLELALARDYLATLRRLQGNWDDAERLYAALIPEATERLGEDHPQVAYFVNNLAGIYRDQERFDRAETLLHRSLALRSAAVPPDNAAIARAELNLAELYRLQGKLGDAEPLYRSALSLADEVYEPDSSERLEFVNQLAVLLREQGRLADAEPVARQALDLAVRSLGPDHPRTAQSELDLADLLRERERCAEALAHDDRAVTIRERVFGAVHPDVGTALTHRAGCLAADPRRANEARTDLDRAIAILSKSQAYPASAADAMALRASLRRAAEPAAARADLGAAVEAVEALRPRRGGGEVVRAEFLGARAELYDRLATWEVEDGNPERGLLAAERGRARALLDQLTAGRDGEEQHLDPESAASLAAARARVGEYRARIAFVEGRDDLPDAERAAELAGLSDDLDQASREFRAAYDRARNASPAWRAAAPASVGSVERIQAEAVPPGGLLLFYVAGVESSLLFVVPPSPSRVEAVPLAVDPEAASMLGVPAGPLTRATLEGLVRGERGVVRQLTAPMAGTTVALRGIGGIAAAADELEPRLAGLFRVLIPTGVRERVLGAREVVVVPDGSLIALPFEALILMPDADAAGAVFWLDDGPPVRYAPSATFLIELGRRAESSRERSEALSVSDPAYGTSATAASGTERGRTISFDPHTLPALPGTARETAAMRQALAGTVRVVTLQGDQAREPAVRRALGGKRFVHLATHGLADRGGNELFAALALTPPSTASNTPDDDGLLELHEIYDLTLDADLAVLSACGSNTGRTVAGEGVFALSRGFLVAGARRVVASQWPVDDDATAVLIGRLFHELAESERGGRSGSVAVALRDAKREVRDRRGWEHPFFWAAFELSGLP